MEEVINITSEYERVCSGRGREGSRAGEGPGTDDAHLVFGRTVSDAGKESAHAFAAMLCQKSRPLHPAV